MNKVCKLVSRLEWDMHDDLPDPASAEVWTGREREDLAPITHAQLDSLVHPSGPWVLLMYFDERALKDGTQKRPRGDSPHSRYQVEQEDEEEEHCRITREELFQPTATLREMRPAGAAAACVRPGRRPPGAVQLPQPCGGWGGCRGGA